MTEGAKHYRRPGTVVRRLMNPLVMGATRRGISLWGSRVLEVRGRRSGLVRQVPVNVLQLDGHEYLVSARGEGEWVRNVRAAEGEVVVVVGRRRQKLVARELPDAEKPAVLRAYLRRWKMEVGVFFEGVDATSSDEQLLRIAARHPVFALANVEASR